MAEIDMTAPTVAPVEGKYGMLRNGDRVGPFKFTDMTPPRFSYFSDPCGMAWTRNGSWSDDPHWLDLIAIIPAPDIVEPDATQETGVVVESLGYEIRAPKTRSIHAVSYRIFADDDGDIYIQDLRQKRELDMSPAAAVAIARAILRMAGESK
jgi:hypothetical protein